VSNPIDLLAIGSEATLDHVAVLPSLPARGDIVFSPNLYQELEQAFYGGCSLNVAVTAAKLGLRVSVACTAGNDFESTGYHSYLKELKIDTRWILKLEKQKSAHCFSLYDRNGDGLFFMDALDRSRSYNITIPVTEFSWIKRLVIFGGPTDSPLTDSCLKIARRAVALEVPVALAIIGDPAKLVPEFLSLADIVFCNRFEAQKICEQFELEGFENLSILGPNLFFITLGKQGSLVISPDQNISIPPIEVSKAIDPTGAGDAYTGAVLAALLKGYPPDVSARIGAVVSSFAVEKKGCQTNLPSWPKMLQSYQSAFGKPPGIN
jgi:ribokinase